MLPDKEMSRYFHAENCNRSIAGLVFEPYDSVAGSWFGVYEAQSDADISNLSGLASNPRNAVTEISASEYGDLLKKKAPALAQSVHSNHPSTSGWQIKGQGAAVVNENPVVEVQPASSEIKTLDDALSISVVEVVETLKTKKQK